jgi:hypothetical protein
MKTMTNRLVGSASMFLSLLAVGCAGELGQSDGAREEERFSCDDSNPCTIDARVHNGCTHSPAADGTACAGGTCRAGACTPKVVSGSFLAATGSGDGFPTYFGMGLDGSVVEDSGQTVSIGVAGIYDANSSGYHQSVEIQPGVYQWTGLFSICDPANLAGCSDASQRLMSDDDATITVTTVPNRDATSPMTRVVDQVSVHGTDWAGFSYNVKTTSSQIDWSASPNTVLQLALSRP